VEGNDLHWGREEDAGTGGRGNRHPSKYAKKPRFQDYHRGSLAAGFASKQSAKNPLCTNCTLDLSRFIRSSTS